MMENSVSVIIPTYNRVESTMKAIHSALNQTHGNLRIVVVDDGSDAQILDSLENRIHELASKKVALIKAPAKRHPGGIRNIGIQSTESEWIAFLDSDDLWMPEKIEIQIREMRKYKARASCTRFNLVCPEESKAFNTVSVRKVDLSELIKSNVIVNSSVLISRTLLNTVGGVVQDYSVRGVEDYATWLRVATLSEWLLIEEELVTYSDDSVDSIRRDTREFNFFDTTIAHLNFIIWSDTGKIKNILKRILRILVQRIAKMGHK